MVKSTFCKPWIHGLLGPVSISFHQLGWDVLLGHPWKHHHIQVPSDPSKSRCQGHWSSSVQGRKPSEIAWPWAWLAWLDSHYDVDKLRKLWRDVSMFCWFGALWPYKNCLTHAWADRRPYFLDWHAFCTGCSRKRIELILVAALQLRKKTVQKWIRSRYCRCLVAMDLGPDSSASTLESRFHSWQGIPGIPHLHWRFVKPPWHRRHRHFHRMLMGPQWPAACNLHCVWIACSVCHGHGSWRGCAGLNAVGCGLLRLLRLLRFSELKCFFLKDQQGRGGNDRQGMWPRYPEAVDLDVWYAYYISILTSQRS